MIRMIFMCDADRVIGASDTATNAKRCDLLPTSMMGEMCKLYKTGHAVLADEQHMMGLHAQGFTDATKYVVTYKDKFKQPKDLTKVVPVADLAGLAKQYQDSGEELLVIGGLAVFKQLLPYTSQLEVLETEELVPGDLVFSEWDNGNFAVQGEERWEGGRTLHLVRH